MPIILVGTDGSKGATTALAWGVGAARAFDAELVVVSVVPPGAEQTAEDVTRLLDESWSAPARHAGQPFRTLVLSGDPRQRIHDVGESDQAVLTVVGASGTGWFPAPHLGSVGHYLAEHTAHPLAIVPQDAASFRATRVILGLDGSPGSSAALRWCCELANHVEAKVSVVHSRPPAARAGSLTESVGWREAAEQDCRQWAVPVDNLGRLEGIEVVEEIPAKAILEGSQRHEADLIVLGTRGTGGFHGLRLGSVALKVLDHATCPTVLVPPANH